MITYYYRTLRDKASGKVSDYQIFQELPRFKVGCWVSVTQPHLGELETLSKELKLDLGHLKDSLDPYEVPRVEKEANVLYVFIRVPVKNKDKNTTQPILFILASDFIATVSTQDHPLFDKLQMHPHLYTSQKAKFFIYFMMELFSIYQSQLASISREANAALAQIERIHNRDVVQLIAYEHTINEYLSAIIPIHEGLNSVLTGKLIQFFRNDRELVEDIFLSSGQLITLAKNQLTFISNTREAYSTIMTNNLNRVIKLFTSLTVLLTIPTIVSSFYGMNIALPLATHPGAFLIIVSGTCLLLSFLVWYFIKNDWL